jgi:outer membrane receptor protein involved in Fe transport
LLGYPSSAIRDFGPPWGERLKEYGLYFQDDWKATRRLTLNLGVRWDLYPAATEAHDRLAN